MSKGICIAGNAIVDLLYPIDEYPNEGELTTIRDGIKKTTGGALCNVIIDLAKLDPKLPLFAVGQIGTDDNAKLIKEKLSEYSNINMEGIKEKGETSFTAVMSSLKNKQRTFFQFRGANAEICEEHFDWDKLNVDLMHIGYILLLDALDAEDEQYGTKMARLLTKAKERGIKTSIDIVSEMGNRFKKIVPPALKYVDYCIINEIEAQQATGVLLHDGTRLLKENMKKALEELFSMGVSTWAVIHAPEGGYAMDKSGEYIEIDSLRLPDGYIKGTVGAGDAFCAGVLYGAYKGMSLAESLKVGVGTAACSLSEEGSTEGVRSFEETMQFYNSMR
ncbi:MAG TPA: carbohydrate kinase family protein [Clostridiales bacterium]|nr:carbohydrate kinase family protein [Clostridiales bacterium]